jgi:4-amino-4-deoxy-L-arabinose transferase-like glycosyltransferase
VISVKENQRAIGLIPLILLVILFVLRLVLVIPAAQQPLVFTEVDSFQYIDLAQGMRQTGQYRSQTDQGIDLLRSPGYPLFLLLGLALGNGALNTIPLLQLLLVFLMAAILYLTGRELGSNKAGYAAAVLYLINPNAAFWSLMMLTETLAAFLLMVAVGGAVKYWRAGQQGWLFLSGLALSAAAITRPIVLPLAVLMAVLLAWLKWRDSHSAKSTLSTLAVIVVGVFALVLPWQLRNATVHGQFTLSEVGDSTFQNWMVAKTMAQVEGMTRDEAVAIIATSPDPMVFSLQYIQDHPAAFVKEQVRGIARTLLGAEYATWGEKIAGEDISNAGMLSALLDNRNPLEFLDSFVEQLKSPWFAAGLFALGYDFLLYGLCLIAIWKNFRINSQGKTIKVVILLILVLAYLLFAPLGAGESRFRAPADPLLALLAGLAFSRSLSLA